MHFPDLIYEIPSYINGCDTGYFELFLAKGDEFCSPSCHYWLHLFDKS